MTVGRRPGVKPTMQFAICNEMFGERPLAEVCTAVKAWGYDGLELAPFTLAENPVELSPTSRRHVRDTIYNAGLRNVGLHWLLARTTGILLTSLESSTRRRTTNYLRNLIELCRDLDGSLLVLGSPQQRALPPGMSRADGMNLAAETLRPLLPLLASTQITLAIEPLPPSECNFIRTAAEACRFIDLVLDGYAPKSGSPPVRLHLDTRAMTSESTSISDLVRTHASRLAHLHVNDPNRLGPGMGNLDFRPILATVREIQYSGWLSVEAFDFGPGGDVIARQSIAALRQCSDGL